MTGKVNQETALPVSQKRKDREKGDKAAAFSEDSTKRRAEGRLVGMNQKERRCVAEGQGGCTKGRTESLTNVL